MMQPHPPADWFEFWVRFVCGALLGSLLGLWMLLQSAPASWEGWLALGDCGLAFGLLAGWLGDRFWYLVLSWWS